MSQDTDAFRVNEWMRAQQGNSLSRVAQHLSHERVAAQQAVTHFIVMLLNIGFIGLGTHTIAAPVLKTDRVGCQDDNPLPGQGWTERLQRIAHQATNFTFSKMSFSMVLMM